MRFRPLVLGLFLAVASWLPLSAAARNTYAPDTLPSAAATCHLGMVVWVNTRSGIYEMPGMTWFGHTRDGRYMCRRDADRAGFRATRNGQ